MTISEVYTYPQRPQRKKKVAKKKEISATAGFIWVRFIREAIGTGEFKLLLLKSEIFF